MEPGPESRFDFKNLTCGLPGRVSLLFEFGERLT